MIYWYKWLYTIIYISPYNNLMTWWHHILFNTASLYYLYLAFSSISSNSYFQSLIIFLWSLPSSGRSSFTLWILLFYLFLILSKSSWLVLWLLLSSSIWSFRIFVSGGSTSSNIALISSYLTSTTFKLILYKPSNEVWDGWFNLLS